MNIDYILALSAAIFHFGAAAVIGISMYIVELAPLKLGRRFGRWCKKTWLRFKPEPGRNGRYVPMGRIIPPPSHSLSDVQSYTLGSAPEGSTAGYRDSAKPSVQRQIDELKERLAALEGRLAFENSMEYRYEHMEDSNTKLTEPEWDVLLNQSLAAAINEGMGETKRKLMLKAKILSYKNDKATVANVKRNAAEPEELMMKVEDGIVLRKS